MKEEFIESATDCPQCYDDTGLLGYERGVEEFGSSYAMMFVKTDEAGISNALKMMLCFILSLLLAITTTVIVLDIQP